MKNLQVVINPRASFGCQVIGQCMDADNGHLYILSDKFQLYSSETHTDDLKIKDIDVDLEKEILDELAEPTNELRFFDFIVESGSILVASKNGYLVRIGVTSFSPKTQCIYKHTKSISSVRLSPSQDLIALADEDNNIYLLSIDGHVQQASNALAEQESLHKPIGVGWGSKETQFFGLDGRLSKEEEKKDELVLSQLQEKAISDIEQGENYKKFRQPHERATTIDWRGDGQYLATLTYLDDLDKHSLKVWNRNLSLQYMSENLMFVERGLICWVPNGQYVCCVQRRNKVINEIAMFEKNGLIHQRITLPKESDNLHLPMSVSYVKDLSWSLDSKILAINMKEFPSGEENLLLYTMQNSHYYLKFCSMLDFPSISGLNAALRWDSTYSNRFHIVASQGSYSEYICSFHVTYSQNNSTVAVVDGREVLITPFDQCIIPPPRCAISITSPKNITNLAINYHLASNLVFGSNGIIYSTTEGESGEDFLSLNGPKIKCFVPKRVLKKHLDLKMHQSFFREKYGHWQHMTIIWDNLIAVSHNTERGSYIFTYDHLTRTGTTENGNKPGLESYVLQIGEWRKKKITHMTYDETVLRDNLIVLFNDGSCVRLSKKGTNEKMQFEIYRDTADNRFGYYYTEVKIAKPIANRQGIIVISLGHDLTLRLNGYTFVSNSCTSFRITTNYLIYTTTDNSMHYVLLKNIKDGETASPESSWSHHIENGGTLVIASESESKVILQMPRGNLEIITPRVLIFSLLTQLLIDQKYFDAIRLARKHHLDTNFLFDYLLRLMDNPESINKFANDIAIEDPTMLNHLLSELEDTDTIIGRYGDIMNHLPLGVGMPNDRLIFKSDKVNQICKSIKLPSTIHYIKPRLLTLLKRKPKEVGRALSIVVKLDKDSQKEAIKFILYFMDIDQLFLEALSTYRTDITIMVASASNKDPKEYLRLLSEFNKIESDLERFYAIDMYTKNYDKALEHALKSLQGTNCSSLDEPAILRIVDLVASKRLYKKAVLSLAKLYDKSPPILTTLYLMWASYGKYLFEKRYYSEAATAYSKAYNYSGDIDSLNKAMNCYKLAGEWKRSMALVARSSIDDITKRKFYEGISNQLLERGQHCEAVLLANISETRAPSELIENLLDKGDWYLAESLTENRADQLFIRNLIRSLTDHLSVYCKALTDDLEKAETQFDRLKQLLVGYREKKVSDNFDYDQLSSDSSSSFDGSETSSEVSGRGLRRPRSGASSIKTRHTSKSGRSQQAKKMRINLRHGSRNEDMALIQELKKYITKQISYQSEAIELCAAHYEYRDFNSARESAETVNGLISRGFELSKRISETLWPPSRQQEHTYSLYERFKDIFNPSDEPFENALFEVLIKPELPNDFVLFDI